MKGLIDFISDSLCAYEGWLFKTKFLQNITHFLGEQKKEVVQHSWVT